MQSYASEIEWLQKQLHQNPASMLYARLADRFLQINEYDRALEYAEKGAVLHPHYASARFVLAKCYFERKEYDKANHNLKEALAVDPTYLAALNLQSEILKKLGDYKSVEDNYNKILDVDPIDDDVHRKMYELQEKQDIALESPETDSAVDEGESIQDEKPKEDLDTAMDETFWGNDISKEAYENPEPASAQTLEPEPSSDSTLDPFSDLESSLPAVESPKTPKTDDKETGPEGIETPFEDDFDVESSRYKEEENRFTELLDNIFSSSLDEEEQREKQERNTIERIVEEDIPQLEDMDITDEFVEKSDAEFEPLVPDKPTPEEKILQSDQQEDHVESEIEESVEEDFELPDDFIALDDNVSTEESTQLQLEEEPKEEADQEENDFDPESTQFQEFLASLELKDQTFEASEEEPQETISTNRDLESDTTETAPPQEIKIEKDVEEKPDDRQIENEKPSEKPETQPASIDVKEDESPSTDDDAKSKGKFFTPTLGEIYAAQGQYAKAIAVFETLMKNNPENEWYEQKLQYLRNKLAEQQNK